MTSYSIYLDDAAALGEDELRQAATETFIAGAARCLLGEYTVVDPENEQAHRTETQYAEAEWWHSARRGWELEALDPGDRAEFRKLCEDFVAANYYNLEALAVAVRERGGPWADSDGWAWYRLGMLLVHESHGAGIGYWEYERITRAAQSLSHAAAEVGEISAWTRTADDGDPFAHLGY